ncbi:MAG: ORF6N domain-containing protein [Bacteroidetes bacterium]|nr:ORF6N domain-containing protein [Bacteroidota bacterium]
MTKQLIIPEEKVRNAILVLRGKRVMVDADLAAFYGVPTKVFNQAVKRNIDRFPEEFMFRLNEKEKNYVVTNCDHLHKLKFSQYLPYAFTEHGAVMAANVLNSPVAIQASIQVVKIFIKITEVLAVNRDISVKIELLERKLGGRLNEHDKELKILFEAIIAFA